MSCEIKADGLEHWRGDLDIKAEFPSNNCETRNIEIKKIVIITSKIKYIRVVVSIDPSVIPANKLPNSHARGPRNIGTTISRQNRERTSDHFMNWFRCL